jgi:hypothetical protein
MRILYLHYIRLICMLQDFLFRLIVEECWCNIIYKDMFSGVPLTYVSRGLIIDDSKIR